MIRLKNKNRHINEGIRNISKNFIDEKKIDESVKNEISKEFPVKKPNDHQKRL